MRFNTMETFITKGIRISVQPTYRMEQSSPEESKHVFSYEIIIENNSTNVVQLLSRHWKIFDSIGSLREVKGDGVVGEQPVLRPGEKFKYQSWCPLFSEIGKMHGTFMMERQDNGEKYRVQIP
ncbi:MAG: Co2+/Mg2+ efflux protein ApaG [Bacteroidota bacterium]